MGMRRPGGIQDLYGTVSPLKEFYLKIRRVTDDNRIDAITSQLPCTSRTSFLNSGITRDVGLLHDTVFGRVSTQNTSLR